MEDKMLCQILFETATSVRQNYNPDDDPIVSSAVTKKIIPEIKQSASRGEYRKDFTWEYLGITDYQDDLSEYQATDKKAIITKMLEDRYGLYIYPDGNRITVQWYSPDRTVAKWL